MKKTVAPWSIQQQKFFNAKTQGRKDAKGKAEKLLSAYFLPFLASLRLGGFALMLLTLLPGGWLRQASE